MELPSTAKEIQSGGVSASVVWPVHVELHWSCSLFYVGLCERKENGRINHDNSGERWMADGDVRLNQFQPQNSIIFHNLWWFNIFHTFPDLSKKCLNSNHLWRLSDSLTSQITIFYSLPYSKFVIVIKQSRYVWTSYCDFRSRFIKFY